MAQTIANVLTGVATLSIREPNDSRAEWSTEHPQAGAYSVKLIKTGTGNDGSTHLQIDMPDNTETVATWTTGLGGAGHYSYYFYNELGTALYNWIQVEFHFEDQTPGSEGWMDVTAVPHQGIAGTGIWTQYDLNTNPVCGFGGWGEAGIGDNFFDWDLGDTLTTVEATVNLLPEVDSCSDWVLTRVRFELWEANQDRDAWVDTVVLNGIPYTIEPGGTAPGMSLSSPFTEIGYTEDGVTVEYTADTADIEVEEETFPIDSVITKESVLVTCNMAESSLYNINKAMAGSVLSGSILTLGGGVNKKMNIKIEGITPSGHLASILMPSVVATGAVGMSYKKDEKTVVPLTLKALKPTGVPAVTIVYNAA